MINYTSQNDFVLENPSEIRSWLSDIIASENRRAGDISYVFCEDNYLYNINVDYLGHHTLTDIISFDYSNENELHGEIYISIDRVLENAEEFGVSFGHELRRVLAHGMLHLCGFKDKTKDEQSQMREKEDYYLKRYKRS